jgi:transcriptional regulator with XRE-family HTH domain
MTLSEYLSDKQISDKAAAEALGIDRSTVANLRTGRRRPSIAIAAKIEAWTKGKVRAATFAASQSGEVA